MALTRFIPSFEIIESAKKRLDLESLHTGHPDHAPKTSPTETLAVHLPLWDNHNLAVHDNNPRSRFRQGTFSDEIHKKSCPWFGCTGLLFFSALGMSGKS
jgi:hypothetical protein